MLYIYLLFLYCIPNKNDNFFFAYVEYGENFVIIQFTIYTPSLYCTVIDFYGFNDSE